MPTKPSGCGLRTSDLSVVSRTPFPGSVNIFSAKCSYWKGRSPAPAGLSEALPHISSSLKYLDNIDNSI